MRTEDGYIIRKCLNGESEAFGLLVDKYKASIYAFTYAKLRNFHDAEDVTQEVFIKAYKNLRTLKRWDSFLAWLYSIASDLCRKWVRSQIRRPDHTLIKDQGAAMLESRSLDSYRENTVYESLHEALDSLPETYRQVLTLYYLGGMNSHEIARFLGASPTAIRKRLSRARLQLREEMVDMMGETLKQQRLQANFTFRVVEAVKRVKINPAPRIKALPWGISATAGVIFTILSLNPNLSLLNPIGFPKGAPLPVEMKVLETGEIPVEVLKTSQTLAIASRPGDGDGGKLRPSDERGDLHLAPQALGVKLKPGNGAAGDKFGYSVAIHGDYAIVGADGRDDKKGAAYIFKRDGNSWKEQQMLFARDGAKEDYFGVAVAISDDCAIVGACDDDDKGEDTGSVYVFHRTGESWAQKAKLTPHGQLIKWCEFGIAVAISGDYLVVGSRFEDHAGGAIYIFKRDGDAWIEQAKLISSNWAQYDRFGEAVSISGDYVIASASYHDNKIGSAYVFKRDGDTWKEQAILTAEDGKAMDFFGYSVSISGDYAIVGARGAGGGWRGASYIFVRDGTSWRQQAKIVPGDLAMDDQFGYSVSISGDYAIVGSIYTGRWKGAIYGFMRDGDTWRQVSKLTATDGAERDYFGKVAFSGNYVIVGANGADVSGADSGAAYIYNCVEDLAFPVEPSGCSATTFGGEKDKPVLTDALIPLPVMQAVPGDFRLLQNFPNPFNPDTWLPYELASDANVMIWIYSSSGELVRRLNPGRQEAGSYVTRDRAAYWDGRNEAGEQVASGTHFYTIQAGEFTATKKMVVTK
jgi:RNA polymerase sigma factor (sigma-70 family)